MGNSHSTQDHLELHSAVDSGLSAISGETRERLFSDTVRTIVREIALLSDDGVVRVTSRRAGSPGQLLAELASAVLESDALTRTLTPSEKIAKANLKGVRALRTLLAEHGGSYTASEVADLLGVTRQAIHKRDRVGQLLTVQQGDRHVYPVWQFHETDTVSGFSKVLQALDTKSTVAKIRFFLNRQLNLGNRTAIDVLREGDDVAVLEAAKRFGQHGAD